MADDTDFERIAAAAERVTIDLGVPWHEEPERTCSLCALTRPREQFPRYGTFGMWAQGRYFECLPCRAIKTRCAKYGISTARFHELYDAQEGRCAICREPADHAGLYIDHCHDTDVVRGLLCHGCNIGIGWLGDDGDRMRRAADYVEAARVPAVSQF